MSAQIIEHPRYKRGADAGMVRNVRVFVDNLIGFYGKEGASLILEFEIRRIGQQKAGSGQQ